MNFADSFIDQELPIDIRAKLYPIIGNAETVFGDIMNGWGDILLSKFGGNIQGRIFTHAVHCQLTRDYLPSHVADFFTPGEQRVNNFGYTVPTLGTRNGIIYLRKSNKKDKIDKAKYLLRAAAYNDEYDNQLTFYGEPKMGRGLAEEKHCLLLIYAANHGIIKNADLVYPDKQLRTALGERNLVTEAGMKSAMVLHEEPQQKTLTALKEDVQRRIDKELNAIDGIK